MNDLSRRTPAPGGLVGAHSVAEMAALEEWTPESYAVVLASNIRNSGVGLSAQTERLAALAGIGGALSLQADETTAAMLTEHLAVLEALHQRFAHEALKALNAGGNKAEVVAERYLSASVKAQRACLAVLSALKVIREGVAPTTRAPAVLEPSETLTLANSN